MRTQTTAESTLLAGNNYGIHQRVKVANGSATLIDLSAWVEEITIDDDIDQPTAQATIEFTRDGSATQSLAQLRTDSTLNRLADGVTYSPQLDAGRLITIEVATIAIGATPISTDWKELFRGYIDSVDASKPTVSVVARDLGSVLVDRWIEVEGGHYGSDSTTVTLQSVMQQLIDNTIGAGVITLAVSGSPSFAIHEYPQQSEPLMDALRTLANQRGWDVRYKWNGTAWALTLFDPPRSKTTPDRTFGPSTYYDVTRLMLNRDDVRNKIVINFLNSVGNQREDQPFIDSASQTRYGIRFFGITLASDSAVDTIAEVTALGNSALSDLKDPKAEQEIEAQFFWPSQLGDLYRFSANGVHYNTDQDGAVTNIRHHLWGGTGRTYLQVRGKPAGGFLTWLEKGNSPSASVSEINNVQRTDYPTTSVFTFTTDAPEVWWNYATVTAPEQDADWETVAASTVPLAAGVFTVTVPRPLDGQVVLLQLEPRLTNLTAGIVRRIAITATPQPPIAAVDDNETATVGTEWLHLTTRGIAVSTVEVQTQVGSDTISAWGTPTRSPGAASVVKGGTLGTLEYEHDVALDATRQSWIVYRITLENGSSIVIGPFGFDRDKNPNVLQLTSSVTTINVLADTDTKSIRVYQIGGTWEYVLDGLSATVDVSKTGTNGVAGLGASASATYRVQARSDPTVNVGGSTLIASRDVVIAGASATPPSATWATPGVRGSAPVAGSDVATITLQATSAPAGYTVKLYIDVDSGTPTPATDNTANVSPALTTPPTASTVYSFATGEIRTASTGSLRELKTMSVRADLLASGLVVDSRTVYASWYVALA